MKIISAAVVGVAALALQASAAPLRVDIIVPVPSKPMSMASIEEALKAIDARPNVPIRVAGYGFVSGGEGMRHPTVHIEASDRKTGHWVYRPAAGEQGTVLVSDGAVPSRHDDEAFRHWVMTHPDIQHGHGHLVHRPQDPNHRWGKQGGCHKSWKSPFNRLANALRKALGLAPVHPFHPNGQPPRVLDLMAPDDPMLGVFGSAAVEKDDQIMRRPDSRWPMPFHRQDQGRHHRFHHHRGDHWHKKPFGRRVMHALYILGPVEGRLVAFVLGLGLGALIRVIFVMGLIAYRSITGRTRRIMLTDDDEEFAPIIVERIFEIREKEEAPAYTAVVADGEQTLAPPS